jgi:hypothetical protein
LVLLGLAILFAPVPAVTAFGSWLLRNRESGLLASFVLGAVIWRLGIWLIPLVGFVLYLGALAAGLGGWIVAMWEQRRESVVTGIWLPRQKIEAGAAAIPPPVAWDAPLAPGSRSATEGERPADEPEDTD